MVAASATLVALLAAVLVAGSAAAGSYASEVLADGPSGYWRFGDDEGSIAADSMRKDPGTYLGAPIFHRSGAVPGDPNTAVTLDGVNDTVLIPNSTDLNPTGALSLELWVRPDGLPPDAATLVRKDLQYLLRLSSTGAVEFRLWKGGRVYEVSTETGVVDAGVWSHVAATWDGATMRIYVDGVAHAALALAGPIDTSSSDLNVGASKGDYDFLAGTIDEFAFYGKALSAARIQAHYTVDMVAPTVALTQPVNGATVSGALSVAATASDNRGVARVDFDVDGVEKASDTSAPYGFSLDTTALANGGHTILAEAFDASGNEGVPSTVFVTVANARTYSAEVLADSPNAYWRLGEASGAVAADQTGRYPGDYLGSAQLGQPGALHGDPNTSVTLDGGNETLRLPGTALNDTNSFSLELWVRPGVLPATTATLVRKDPQYLLRLTSAGEVEFRLWKAGEGYDFATGLGAVNAGLWSHVVATWDGQTMRIYVNGVDRASRALAAPIDASTNPLFLGSSLDSYDFLAASLDEFAVYPTVLSASRVLAHYTAATGSAPDATPPTVSITQPSNGATVSGQVSVSASASDNVGVARVDFSVDGVQNASDTGGPYGFTLDTTALANGAHTITARAYDASGNASVPSTVSVTVSNASQPACTWYASPSGSASNSGTSPTSPLTLAAAYSRTQPGNVVCLMAGTYPLSSPWYVERAGTPGHYIVYRSYGGTATIRWTGGLDTMISVTSLGGYVEFNGLTIDAQNLAGQNVNCSGTDHVRVIGNTLMNGGSAGFSSIACDYVTVDHNLIYHAGYQKGFSSAISFLESVRSDSYAGFHMFATNNIISGSYDNSDVDADGNGIIVDTGGEIPAVLIANNLVYENYYRCLEAKEVAHVWMVNNSCYKNALRPKPASGFAGEITSFDSSDVHLVNNVAFAWTPAKAYESYGGSVVFQRNAAYGGLTSDVPASVLADPNQLRVANPLFVDAPLVDPLATGQWASALPPWQIGTRLTLQAGSSLLGQGIDPRNATGMTADLRTGIDAYLSKDLAGNPRPVGGPYDLGAYER